MAWLCRAPSFRTLLLARVRKLCAELRSKYTLDARWICQPHAGAQKVADGDAAAVQTLGACGHC